MRTIFQKNTCKFAGIFLFCGLLIFSISCRKDISQPGAAPGIPDSQPDLQTKVISSVSGFVTDQDNAAVAGAIVKAGTVSTITNLYGYFEIKNVQVVKEAATVSVTYAGYFKGIKTYLAAEGKAAFFRIKLLPKTIAGNIDAGSGGIVSLSNGTVISFPANGIKNATTGVAYSGTVNVAAQYIDPTSVEINQVMPGDLRGINADGNLKALNSYGMMAVELTGNAGELLQIADGKKSTLTMPVPTSLSSAAPATIPLWYFDEVNGLWKEDGIASKTGNNYVGEVSHFSFWNCDIPFNAVIFDCIITDQHGLPIPYTLVKISVVGDETNTRSGYTDINGYVSGPVPGNSQLHLQINSSSCAISFYSQDFTTNTNNVSLGTISVNQTSVQPVTVTGTVTKCNGQAVSNGNILVIRDNQNFCFPINNNGAYSFDMYLCNNVTADISLIATDNDTLTQSATTVYTLQNGTNTIPNIQACGVNPNQYIRYRINNGQIVTYQSPVDDVTYSVTSLTSGGNTDTSIVISGNLMGGTGNFSSITIEHLNISTGSVQPIPSFYFLGVDGGAEQNPVTPLQINISEYGPAGGYISGNFASTFTSGFGSTYSIQYEFKVRRGF